MSAADRAAIRRLRTGVVPSWEFDFLSVGYDAVTEQVGASLGDLATAGHAVPLFVRGEWGTGKTHLLSYIRASATSRGFATSVIGLNARSAALSHPQRLFPAFADSIRARGVTGLRSLVLALLQEDETRSLLATFAQSPSSSEFGAALAGLCREFERGDRLGLGNHPAWRILYGADLCWSDHGSKRERALSRMDAMARLFRAVGLGGLVMIIDEAETIDQLWNIRSRLSAYAVLERLCAMAASWCVLATTLRFDRTIENDHRAVHHGSGSAAPGAIQFVSKWCGGDRQTIQPPTVDDGRAHELAIAVYLLYEAAYEKIRNGDEVIERCLTDWRRNPGRNPRRLIRLLVDAFDADRGLPLAVSA